MTYKPRMGRPHGDDLEASRNFSRQLLAEYANLDGPVSILAEKYGLHTATIWRRIQWAREEQSGKRAEAKALENRLAKAEAEAESLRAKIRRMKRDHEADLAKLARKYRREGYTYED